MFRAHSGHHQEVNDSNCTYSACGIVTLSFLSGCTRQSPGESEDTRGCIRTIWVIDLLMMGGMRSKHVEEFSLM